MNWRMTVGAALALLAMLPGCGSQEAEPPVAESPARVEETLERKPETVAWTTVSREVLPGRIAASGSFRMARMLAASSTRAGHASGSSAARCRASRSIRGRFSMSVERPSATPVPLSPPFHNGTAPK